MDQNEQNKQQQNRRALEGAIKTGLKMLTSEDISTPNAWNADLVALQKFLTMVITGQLMVGAGPNANTANTDKRPTLKPVDTPDGPDKGGSDIEGKNGTGQEATA